MRSRTLWGGLLGIATSGCGVPSPPGTPDDTASRTDTDTVLGDDSGDEADTDAAPDTLPPVDTDRPDPSGTLACYPGPDGRYATCLDVVAHGPWGADYDYPPPTDARYAAPTHYLDLVASDPTTRVSPNFRLQELAQAWKGTYGVVQVGLVEHLQEIRDLVGAPVFVNSGYRNVGYNAGVGGATRSRHMWGDAADLRTDVLGVEALGAVCETVGADYVGYYEAHVHCDWRSDPLDDAFFQGPVSVAHRDVPPPWDARLVPGTRWTAPAVGWDEGEPMRVWTAWDATGQPLVRATGRSFAPPPDAACVEVDVGRQLVRAARITEAGPVTTPACGTGSSPAP